jgi:hypothetical protein
MLASKGVLNPRKCTISGFPYKRCNLYLNLLKNPIVDLAMDILEGNIYQANNPAASSGTRGTNPRLLSILKNKVSLIETETNLSLVDIGGPKTISAKQVKLRPKSTDYEKDPIQLQDELKELKIQFNLLKEEKRLLNAKLSSLERKNTKQSKSQQESLMVN